MLAIRRRSSYSPFTLVLVASGNTFPELNLGGCPELRVIEVRIETSSCAFNTLVSWLTNVLGTVTSLVFSKFILSLDDAMLNLHAPQVTRPTTCALDWWVARLFNQSRMLLIIKGSLSRDWLNVLRYCFPLSTGAGAIRFEFPDPVTIRPCEQGR